MATKLTYIDPLDDLLGEVEPAPGQNVEPIPAIVTESQLAQLVGLTASRLRTLARDGVLVKAGRGRYDVRASLLGYIAGLRDKASRTGHAGGRGTPATTALNEEKLRLAKQQADKIELQNDAARGEQIGRAHV